MDINLKDKLAVVTGGSGKLGRVICRVLAECGADVVVHYHRNEAQAAKVVDEVLARGVRCISVQADIGDEGSVQAMRTRIESELGIPDIIVNNAVGQYAWKDVLHQPAADYEGQFRSCVLQNVLMAQAFVPGMIGKRRGRIIAINTECSMLNLPNQSAYVSGKRGMDGVLRVLAKEIGEHQITVNQVAPGWMISDKYRATGEERQPAYEQNIPLRHRGQDQDIANAVAFLASDLAAFISGAYLPVCGGNVMPTI